MEPNELKKLAKTAIAVRKGALRAIHAAKSGHPGGSLSAADLLAYLYFREMRVAPDHPHDPERDRFVLSKGHCCPALYAVLAEKGYFPPSELDSLRHNGAMLQGHPDMKHTPGIDMSTGSLGQGISAACGMALAGKMDGLDYRVYTLLGDGELEEGQVWEAAMFAAHSKLDNLCVIVDWNGLQIDGPITQVCSPEPIDRKFEAFGFAAAVIDGHDFEQLESAFARAGSTAGKPFAIIAKTIKGKGVSFMENRVEWHGAAPNDEQYRAALAELTETEAGL